MIFSAVDNSAEPRATPLYAAAAGLCATNAWTSVNGWALARSYSDTVEEYEAALNDVAFVDLGPLCRYSVRGAEAGAFLARLTSCPATDVCVAESARGLIVNAEGFVVDCAETTRLSKDLFLLTTSVPVDRRLLVAARGFDVEISNVAGQVGALGLIGPKARDAAAAAGVDILAAEASAQGRVRGVELAVRPVAIGALTGIEVIFPAEDALVIFERVRGKTTAAPMGLDAMEILRIEGGVPRTGVDFVSADDARTQGDARSPDEIGLPHLAPPNRGWFNGRRAVKNAARARRRLVLLSLDCDAAPPGVSIRTRAGIAGVVTSAAFSPKLKRVLCFADLDRDAPLGDLEAVIGPDGSRVPARALESFEGRRAAAFRENL